MEPGSTRIPAAAGIPNTPPLTTIIVANTAWRRLLRNPEAVVARAARAAGMTAIIVLSSDTEVKRLNARHRGRSFAAGAHPMWTHALSPVFDGLVSP